MSKKTQFRDGTTQIVPLSGARALSRATIEILNAEASPRTRQLTNGSLVMGAGLAADIVINDAGVSRRHAQLTLLEHGVDVRDLGSRNGTFYQGQRIERITLERDGTLQLGSVHVRVLIQPGDGPQSEHEVVRFGDVIGGCRSMQQIIRTLERLRDSMVPLLVVGESGTGKELVARAIHQHSSTSEGAFVAVDCGALERESARAELFEKAIPSADGANATNRGAFDVARGGTIFLDEIGDLPVGVQPLLLRALDGYGSTGRNDAADGSTSPRVIATTQRDLLREVKEGRFRDDLYHRLNVVKIELPPLRERGDDVVLLAHQFASEFDIRHLSPEVIEQLCNYEWPGNVRELRNVLRGYAAVGVLPRPKSSEPEEGFAHLLRLALDLELPYQEQKERLVNRFIDVYLTELLRRTNGNQSEAARIAGLDRAHLNKMVARLRRQTGSVERWSKPTRDSKL